MMPSRKQELPCDRESVSPAASTEGTFAARFRVMGIVLLGMIASAQAFQTPIPARHGYRGDKSSLVSVEGRAERGQRIMARRGFLTVTQDEVVQRVKPILCGKWLLKETRVDRKLWGKQFSERGVEPPASKCTHEVVLVSKGRLEQPLDSTLRGLGWDLVDKDMFGSSKLEFKIVHPPPEQKLDANDQLPSIHYYSGQFCEGLHRVEGWIERYADVEEENGIIRKRVVIGRFRLDKESRPSGLQPMDGAAGGW